MEHIMKKIKLIPLLISLSLALLLTSCAATSVTGTWKEASYNKPIKKVLVIGLGKKDEKVKSKSARRIFEDTISKDIKNAGAQAQVSLKYFNDNKTINKKTLAPIVKKEHFDTVLIARIVAVDKENRYVATGYPNSYSSMYGYYGQVSPYYREAGYYVQNTIVSLEINLYETKSAKLIWAITTETFEPDNINKEIQKLSTIIIDELKKEKLL